MRIGEAAARTGLSMRTLRYYEEVGLVTPSARSQGGFRLYAESDVARLEQIKRMKPLGFQLDEMRELLELLHPDSTAPLTETQRERLRQFGEAAERRCRELRTELATAEEFAAALRRRLDVGSTVT
ncbi:MerR family transcriptional regulator [Prauserella cavernicola]|uniref:MerR family transcriptional regulator n=1 Tax=Prauserella cavernicola TaxID=2800127 RepID=A0A934V419_9PSEU|nr:MerR family transcriptional regulator [Prauserella cavernicola]MBK1784284.1 MerR family transcriptional regulator [Prauserella cavernicola]